MPPSTRLQKPVSRKGKRVLEKKAPKAIEDCKRALLLMGNKTSQTIKDVLGEMAVLKKPDVQRFSRKNDDVRPFEAGGEASLEFFTAKSDCSLFALGSHSKKRAHNLILGRMYDNRLYDMVELGVDSFKPLKAFNTKVSVNVGDTPCFIFMGEQFESVPEMRQAKSILLDFFRGQETDQINLADLSHVIVVTALSGTKILFRHHAIRLKKSGSRVPRVELQEIGPSLDLSLRRHRSPTTEMEKAALQRPVLGKRKEKNIHHDLLDGRVGRIYMPQQDVASMATKKFKGTKRARQDARAAATGQAQEGGDVKRRAAVED